MRVLHVDTATEWRGGQVQLVHLVSGMVRRHHDVSVACPEGTPLWGALDFLGAGRIPLPPGRTIRGALKVALAEADLVAAHTSHAHTTCLGVKRPLVVHRRVDFVPSGGWKYRRPDAYVAVSAAVAGVLGEAGVDNVEVVHSGVVSPPRVVPAADGPAVLAVGARVPHKGHVHLAAAAEQLPGVDIGVAGEGPLTYPGIRWLGHRADVPALLAAAEVFAHPSTEEGLGTAVIEAMLAEVPVVTSDAGGLPEVVGEFGHVVPRGDPAALAAGIRAVLAGDHPSVTEASAWAQRCFGVDRMVDETLAVYQGLV